MGEIYFAAPPSVPLGLRPHYAEGGGPPSYPDYSGFGNVPDQIRSKEAELANEDRRVPILVNS